MHIESFFFFFLEFALKNKFNWCISFLLSLITNFYKQQLKKNTNILSSSSMDNKPDVDLTGLKSRCLQGHVPSHSFWGRMFPCLFQLLDKLQFSNLKPTILHYSLLFFHRHISLWLSSVSLLNTLDYIGYIWIIGDNPFPITNLNFIWNLNPLCHVTWSIHRLWGLTCRPFQEAIILITTL